MTASEVAHEARIAALLGLKVGCKYRLLEWAWHGMLRPYAPVLH